MSRGLFVTGTGTGVGKTFVTAALARRACALGQRVFAFKPIETGCTWNAGTLVGGDQEQLAVAAGDWQRGELRGLYRLETPVAPRAAARLERVVIELEHIRQTIELGAGQADLMLVEGAGGWRVPIADDADISTLAVGLGLPILVVATAGLGTINHSLLTVEAVRRDGSSVAAVVLSRHPQDDRSFTFENASEIERIAKVPVLVLEDDPVALDALIRVP